MGIGIFAAAWRRAAAMTAQSPALRILLVEDHADTAEVFARLLETRGFRVSVAGTFASALDQARRLPFDLLLCDIQLPDGNGLELLPKLRNELGMDDLRAVAFSGYGGKAIVQRAKEAGFDAYMLKPVEMGKLFGLLEQVCSSEHPPRSPRAGFIAILAPTVG